MIESGETAGTVRAWLIENIVAHGQIERNRKDRYDEIVNAVRQRNPFKPTFGASPPLLVGRDELLQDFSEALDAGRARPREPQFTLARAAPARP